MLVWERSSTGSWRGDRRENGCCSDEELRIKRSLFGAPFKTYLNSIRVERIFPLQKHLPLVTAAQTAASKAPAVLFRAEILPGGSEQQNLSPKSSSPFFTVQNDSFFPLNLFIMFCLLPQLLFYYLTSNVLFAPPPPFSHHPVPLFFPQSPTLTKTQSLISHYYLFIPFHLSLFTVFSPKASRLWPGLAF